MASSEFTGLFKAAETLVVGGVKKLRLDKTYSDEFGGVLIQVGAGIGSEAHVIIGSATVDQWCEKNGYVLLAGREGPFHCISYDIYVLPVEKKK